MWKIQYFLIVASFFLGVVLVFQLLKQRRAPGSTLAWILVMAFAPHVGVPLYLVLGTRKLRKISERKKGLYRPLPYPETPSGVSPVERLLLASGAPAKTDQNEVRVLASGRDAFDSLVAAIRGAKTRIDIATFILTLDPVGNEILNTLQEKARQGVQVRVLLDGLGSFWDFRWHLRGARRAGVKISFFLPMFHIPFLGHSNLRNHRKLAVIDGEEAIVGGMNLSREYMGPDQDPHRWCDLSLSVRGPAVRDIDGVFAADWEFASKERVSVAEGARKVATGPETIEVVASGPDVLGDPLYDAIAMAVFDAKTRVWIATPYFIPDETLSKALELAARRGVDVRVLIPARSNHRLADMCRGSYLRQLSRAGGKVYFYKGTMMHAKALIIDDQYAIVGSANFDMRSLLLNFELGLVLYSQSAIRSMGDWFESLLSRTTVGQSKETWVSDILDGVGRILGPIL